jgi:DNA-directed RNA polymerase subunit RPC12/RpoP
MITCPECQQQFRLLLDESDADEEYGPRAECPECGTEFDPETA